MNFHHTWSVTLVYMISSISVMVSWQKLWWYSNFIFIIFCSSIINIEQWSLKENFQNWRRFFKSPAHGECCFSCSTFNRETILTYNIFNKWILEIILKYIIQCNFYHFQCCIFWMIYLNRWIGTLIPVYGHNQFIIQREVTKMEQRVSTNSLKKEFHM